MTKIKRTVALMMVLVMAMSVLALPASAAIPQEETVAPCAAVTICKSCGVNAYTYFSYTENATVNVAEDEMICYVPAHSHTVIRTYSMYRCTNCGYGDSGYKVTNKRETCNVTGALIYR